MDGGADVVDHEPGRLYGLTAVFEHNAVYQDEVIVYLQAEIWRLQFQTNNVDIYSYFCGFNYLFQRTGEKVANFRFLAMRLFRN